MSDAEDTAADPILGAALDDAVATVLDREPDADPETVRSTLALVAEDGTVSREGVNAALGEAAQYVATPENRLESAETALKSAREAATPAEDLDAVRSRLDEFVARYQDLEDDMEALLDRLDDLGEEPDDVYDFARSVEALKWDVRPVHERIEELRSDLDAFETWANDPDVRFDDLADDASYVAELLDGIETATDDLDAAANDDPAVVWADATLQCRVVRLLVDDLRAELSDLRSWPDAERPERASSVAERLEALDERVQALGKRLDSLARPAWRERFGEQIEAAEADVEAFEPPVEWGAVRETLAEHRSALGAET